MYKNNKKINKGFSIRDVNSELGLLDEDLSGVSVGVWKWIRWIARIKWTKKRFGFKLVSIFFVFTIYKILFDFLFYFKLFYFFFFFQFTHSHF